MTTRCLRAALIAGAAFISIGAPTSPAHAQRIVFDPTNYSQNVLTAARALEQVNNQIQSLENEAKMLTNQAKNLASLPYSSLTQLQQSISQTEQLLSQAQRIAYGVSAIDQAFRQTYPQSYSGSTSSVELLAGAQARWQNSFSGFQDAMRVQAGVVQNLDSTHSQNQCARLLEPVRIRRAASCPVRKSAHRTSDDPARRSDGCHGRNRPGPKP
jgi:P-type conjugative transfer protein TrbJ